MRVIISTVITKELEGYLIVPSIKEAVSVNDIDCLIINRDIKDMFDLGVHITKMSKDGKGVKFFYISETIDAGIKATVLGTGGVCLTDEFYFDDAEELNGLIDDYMSSGKSSTELACLGLGSAVETVRDFIRAYESGDECMSMPFYLDHVKDALHNIEEASDSQLSEIVNMSESVVDIFERASTLMHGINSLRKEAEEKCETLAQLALESKGSALGGSSVRSAEGVYAYPTYRYSGASKVLVIVEDSPCRYLTSFVLYYMQYLVQEKHKKVKLIFVHERGLAHKKKYAGCPSISNESYMNNNLYEGDIIATSHPINSVMKQLMGYHDDIIIVVDRLHSTTPIVSGRTFCVHAVSGKSDLERFKLSASDCIFTTSGPKDAMITIKHFDSYPDSDVARMSIYRRSLDNEYNTLNNRLRIG